MRFNYKSQLIEFKPRFIPLVSFFLALGILISMSSWQFKRLKWKESLINLRVSNFEKIPEQLDSFNDEDSETIKQIKDLLETRVRPAVAMDGGDITFCSFESGVVTLQMKGACAGCPSSTATLKMGIENMLRHYIPEVTEVRAAEL